MRLGMWADRAGSCETISALEALGSGGCCGRDGRKFNNHQNCKGLKTVEQPALVGGVYFSAC